MYFEEFSVECKIQTLMATGNKIQQEWTTKKEKVAFMKTLKKYPSRPKDTNIYCTKKFEEIPTKVEPGNEKKVKKDVLDNKDMKEENKKEKKAKDSMRVRKGEDLMEAKKSEKKVEEDGERCEGEENTR